MFGSSTWKYMSWSQSINVKNINSKLYNKAITKEKNRYIYEEKKIDSEGMLNKILDVLFTMLQKSRHASIEKRVLRAILGRSLKKRFLQGKC